MRSNDLDSSNEFTGSSGDSYAPVANSGNGVVASTQHSILDARKVAQLEQALAEQKRLNARLAAVTAPEQADSAAPDVETTAQRVAKQLFHACGCALVGVYQHQQDQHWKLLAAEGTQRAVLLHLPSIEDLPLIRQALEKDCVFTDAPLVLEGITFQASLAAPILAGGSPQGLLLMADTGSALLPADTQVARAAAAQIAQAWSFAGYTGTLTEFVQSITNLSMVQSAGSLLEVIASTARRTLNASCTFVATLHQQEWLLRGAGKAPLLSHSLEVDGLDFLKEAMHTPYTFRLRDLRSDPGTAVLQTDIPAPCTLLASPIRTNGLPAGVLLAFGKVDGDGFTDSDVFLAELLTAHAALNLENCYMNLELRNNLKTTQLLYELGLRTVQAETLKQAAEGIARAAWQLMKARRSGLQLFAADGHIEAEVIYARQEQNRPAPVDLVAQAMYSRQNIYLSESDQVSYVAIPLQTPRRCFGALWLELAESEEEVHRSTEDLYFLINQASVALERSVLLEETRRQAQELTRANVRLNETYDETLKGLMRTLDARDRETEGHSERVTDMAVLLGAELGLHKAAQKALERGALLHDIGKIGISDTILLKRGALSVEEWEQMRRHPEIGAQIVREIPSLHDALPVIAFHHERWNGSGYPLGLAGKEIPFLARLFAVIDVFDALTRARPYRKSILSTEQAIAYLKTEAGSLFDPVIVERFEKLVQGQMSLALWQGEGARSQSDMV